MGIEISERYDLPHEEWREGQKELVDRLANLFEDDFPAVSLEAPTGSGKSAVAIAVANKLDLDWWYVTKTLQLQNQVVDDYDASVIYGRSNYDCARYFGISAKECPFSHSDDTCPSESECEYLNARRNAVESGRTVFNYQYFLNIMNYTNLFEGNNTLCILDEVHNLEEELMRFITTKFNFFDFSMMREDFPTDNREQIIEILKASYRGVCDELEELKVKIEENINDEEVVEEFINKANKYKALKRKLEFVREYYDETWTYSYYKDVDEVTNSWLVLKPTMVDKFIQKMLHSDILLMMSATIGEKEVFTNSLGLKSGLVPKIETESYFDKRRRPMYYDPACKMSKDDLNQRLLLEKVDEIMDKEVPNGKGMIHTHSYDIADMIELGSEHHSDLIWHGSENREEKMEEFKETNENKVFVTPSFNEGIDLKYDNLNWQIMVKVPFLYLGDEQIKKRMEMDRDWYMQQTINALVQTYGRGMRAEDDYCLTYMIDKNFAWVYKRNKYMFPEWFKEAVVTERPNMERFKEVEK